MPCRYADIFATRYAALYDAASYRCFRDKIRVSHQRYMHALRYAFAPPDAAIVATRFLRRYVIYVHYYAMLRHAILRRLRHVSIDALHCMPARREMSLRLLRHADDYITARLP